MPLDLGFLGNLLTTGTQAAGDYENASAQAAQNQRQSVLQQIMLQRQQQNDAIANGLKLAQTGAANALSTYRGVQAGTGTAQPPGMLDTDYFEGDINHHVVNSDGSDAPPISGAPISGVPLSVILQQMRNAKPPAAKAPVTHMEKGADGMLHAVDANGNDVATGQPMQFYVAPKTPTPRPAPVAASKALGTVPLLQQADSTLDSVGSPSIEGRTIGRIPLIGSGLTSAPNASFNSAAQQWVKLGGNASEIPSPTDSKQQVDQKSAMRKARIQQQQTMGARALPAGSPPAPPGPSTTGDPVADAWLKHLAGGGEEDDE